MSIALPLRLICRLVIISMLVLGVSCSVPQKPANRYQSDIEIDQPEASPVIELQSQALAAIKRNEYQQAIDYLQRAIKIQPRNAWNWHYLAQAYWHDGNYDRCRSMIDRSSSYGSYDSSLTSANDKLLPKCQG
jgi:Flp pilus assembly protein TadD